MNTNNDTVLCLPCHWVMPCKKLELKISWKKFFKFPLLTTISAINFLCLNNYQKILSSPHIFQNCVVAFFSMSKAGVDCCSRTRSSWRPARRQSEQNLSSGHRVSLSQVGGHSRARGRGAVHDQLSQTCCESQ